MIRSIALHNFQSHKKTELELSEGVNIIHGPSDNGKSVIIRGLKWVVLNRPNGDTYRRHGSNKTQVIVENDNSIVTRRRSNKKNEYEMDGDVFKALRMEVPESISSVINLDEANIQSQNEVYFLIDLSPGKISKKLNEVAGLEITHQVIQKVNKEVRAVNTDVNATNKALVNVQRELLDLEWVIKADKFLSKLEKFSKKLEKAKDKQEGLIETVKEIEEINTRLEEFISDEAVEELDSIFIHSKYVRNYKFKLDSIFEILNEIDKVKSKSSNMTVINIEQLISEQNKLVSEQNKLITVSNIIENVKTLKKQHKKLNTEYGKTRRGIIFTLRKLGKCPTCGAKT